MECLFFSSRRTAGSSPGQGTAAWPPSSTRPYSPGNSRFSARFTFHAVVQYNCTVYSTGTHFLLHSLFLSKLFWENLIGFWKERSNKRKLTGVSIRHELSVLRNLGEERGKSRCIAWRKIRERKSAEWA